ncbi:hypothetical protein [Streptococcus merionis]|uniref:hypothetical protein n=1 Tax=Streptococcus merionis TaxID=400065 RepID=UPI0026F2035E|nr:hypothetical protein [Streptococcus merionis]
MKRLSKFRLLGVTVLFGFLITSQNLCSTVRADELSDSAIDIEKVIGMIAI